MLLVHCMVTVKQFYIFGNAQVVQIKRDVQLDSCEFNPEVVVVPCESQLD